MEGSAGLSEHPYDEDDEQDRPNPAEQAERVGGGSQDEECGAGDAKAERRGACPALRLVCVAGREYCEERAAGCQRKQREPGNHRLAAAAEHKKIEHEPEDETGRDRTEHDQADVAAPRHTTLVRQHRLVHSLRQRRHVAPSASSRVDLEAEHHSTLVVLGDVAVRHPQARV